MNGRVRRWFYQAKHSGKKKRCLYVFCTIVFCLTGTSYVQYMCEISLCETRARVDCWRCLLTWKWPTTDSSLFSAIEWQKQVVRRSSCWDRELCVFSNNFIVSCVCVLINRILTYQCLARLVVDFVLVDSQILFANDLRLRPTCCGFLKCISIEYLMESLQKTY